MDGGSAGGGSGGGGGGSEGDKKKKPPEGESKSKRKMKTASQLEILEKTYAVETYPSEALRAELSVKLGLSDRQLQMWFCHRRLKDRKPTSGKRGAQKESPVAAGRVGGSAEEMVAGEVGNEQPSGSGSGSSPLGHGVDSRSRRVGQRTGVAVARIGVDMPAVKRYYEPLHSVVELRAIAFVEAQLGEPLKEDGPILGMEFDPLPPDAFGAPIGTATVGQQKQAERPDAKLMKGSARAPHEYQFLPEQPTVRTDAYERAASSYHFSSPGDVPTARTSLSTGRSFVHGNEQLPSGYGFPNQSHSLNLLSQQGRHSPLLSSASAEYDNVPRKNSFMNIGVDPHFGAHPITTLENPFISSEKRVNNEEDVIRMDRKRKQSDEARIAREVEAHEKRIRKELEKQDILRRKREEQRRKEMERHDRERRKEEERLLREKQREEERYQREQRREVERREKFLQKESIRAEKMKQKEEMRRKKEAARLKAANERAIARRIAKESMELIQDERLELMELAASSHGLPSITALDFETLQNLELFKDMLKIFPPKSVQLKKPFSIQPWIDSEDNIGNLLMVWRFLITFADVLGLWPFTLDEFVQAFHDYDPRLLGEIHVALLRSIIKDIEDVARTPSNGLGANQNGSANPGGGHPQIVEGAYTWGFDIRSWHRHLNPLTWPEILRQFALSAGFGPKLKKRDIEQSYLRDDNEGNDGGDVISNLRNGAAAENAVAIMQERGFSNQRRSRHRLTPGTVKYAAFHILSLEGSKGLTIMEVADKIQKSGLRDLTTSRTPEASIAAALSRDSKLFERTAPSTYCVRPAYRKDSVDAEGVISSARERIRIFKSGFLDGEEADDAERDEDYESDVAEDPEVYDLGAELNPKDESQSQEAKRYNVESLSGNGKESETPKGDFGNDGLPSMISERCSDMKVTGASVDVAGICNGAMNIVQEDTDVDESNPGEPWVQGLMEGEYSDLSVEERLNALVALIGVALEGNSIRIVLEERLEAASALKKQMWAEAQLDKRRFKEDYVLKTHYSSHTVNRSEPNHGLSSAECRQSPVINLEEKNNEASMDPVVQQEQLTDPQNDLNDFSVGPDNLLFQQQAAEKSRSQLKSYIGHKAEEMYVYRSLPLGVDRRRNRYWRFITSASLNDPGCGRIFVELHDGHWRLIDSEEGFDALVASLDLRGVRESHLHSMLQNIEVSFKESVRRNMLRTNLGQHGGNTVNEKAVKTATGHDCNVGIHSPSNTMFVAKSEMSDTSSSFIIELGDNETETNQAFRRYEDVAKWMWKEGSNCSALCATKYGKKWCMQLLHSCDYCHDIYFFEENHCGSCHKTYGSSSDFSFSEHVMNCEQKLMVNPDYIVCGANSSSLRIRLLKLLLAMIEDSVPPEALQSVWTDCYRKSWGMKLHASSSAEDLLQILTVLESSMRRDYLSSKFETTSELLGSNKSGSAAWDSSNPESVPVLPWIPQTTAAVALRLMEFDSSISYVLHQKMESQNDDGAADFVNLPSTYATEKNTLHDEIAETSNQGVLQEENWFDIGIGLASMDRGRGGRGRGRGRSRGGRSQRRVNGSRSESGRRSTVTNNERVGQVMGWKGRHRGRGGYKRGRRSVRSRQKPANRVVQIVGQIDTQKEIILEKSPRELVRDEWNGDEGIKLNEDSAENGSSSERFDYDENGLASGDEYDRVVVDDYTTGFNRRSDDMLDGSDYNVDDDEDDEDDGDGDNGGEDEQVDLDVEGYINGDSDEEDNRIGDGELNREIYDNAGSTSTDYSD